MAKQTLNRFPDSSMMTLTMDKVRHDLAESVGPDLHLSDLIGDMALSDLQSMPLEYGTAAGSLSLRSAVATQHGVAPEDVVITVGGMHAIFLCGLILCNPKDHVLVQQPAFPMTHDALAFNGANVEFLRCAFDTAYQIDCDDLIKRLQPNTSLVCLASPQNPSGVSIPKDGVIKVLDAMQSNCPNAFLLLDETYRQATYGDQSAVGSLVELDRRIISCASLSKCHGAPGLRIGWAITRDSDLRQQLLNGKFQTIISCSGIDEALALHLVQHSDELLSKRSIHLQEGLDTVAAWIDKHSTQLDWVRPDAGALCCVRLSPGHFDQQSIERFHSELKRHSTRVAPGEWFGDEPGVFRLGFGMMSSGQLKQALEVVSNVLESFH